MLALDHRMEVLEALAAFLQKGDASLQHIIEKASNINPWFTPDNCFRALRSIRDVYLDGEGLRAWAHHYSVPQLVSKPQTVALVFAGNIPLVGFHDWLSVFISGHRAMIRCSEKDNVLMPWLLDWLATKFPGAEAHWIFVDQLKHFDAVIATGSDNSARYFRAYFSKFPHIIRPNRNGVAVLYGDESLEQLDALTDDVFSYFGLGCRNVSHLFVPEGYDFQPLLGVLDRRGDVMDSHRYRNNYDYQLALLLLNKATFYQTGNLLLKEDPALISPVSTLHYSSYRDKSGLLQRLSELAGGIQCIVSTRPISGCVVLEPGMTQKPGLRDYADEVDTMLFLSQLTT